LSAICIREAENIRAGFGVPFRRSYTIGKAVTETTKTGAEPDVALPDELVA
jgi:hypothetical protein